MEREYPYTLIPMEQYRQISGALEDALDYIEGGEDDSGSRIDLQRSLEKTLADLEETTLVVSHGAPL